MYDTFYSMSYMGRIERGKIMSFRIGAKTAAKIARLAKRDHTSESEVIRRALESYDGGESAAALAGDLIGSVDFDGPSDLASNKRHLAGFGR